MLVNFDGRLEINDDEAPRLALPEDLIQKDPVPVQIHEKSMFA